MIKQFFKIIFHIAGAFFIFLILAEGISHFFLPAPTIHKFPFVHFVADPACGYRLQPNQKAFSLGSAVTVNQWGFRGKNWTLEKPEGTIRIAVLGSSYAFGHGVNDEEMFPAQLEKILNQNPPPGKRYEVMSFGLGGYDSGHEMGVLKAHALKFHPDIVILDFFFNDLFYIKDYGFYSKMFAIQDRQFRRWRWEMMNFGRRSRLAMFLWDNFNERLGKRAPGEVEGAVKAYVEEGVLPPAGPNSEGWLFIADRLKEFKKLSEENHFMPVFTIIPTHQEMLNKNAKNAYLDYLTTHGRELSMPPVRFIDDFRKTNRDLMYYMIPYDFHLSAVGHRFIAEVLAKKVLNP